MAAGPVKIQAQESGGKKAVSCEEFLVPKVEIKGRMIGQDSCQMMETDFIFEGRKFRRMDMGISGNIDGYITKQGRYSNYFLSNPEFTYFQGGNKNQPLYGIGRFEADRGSALIFMYPLDRSAWNGKEWVTVHGAGVSFKEGSLKPWDKNLNPADPLADISKYEKLMLEKGYAVAKTRRSTPYRGGDIEVKLEDGSISPDHNMTEQPRLMLGFAKVGWNVLEKRLGKKPTRTYWYGHSNGGRSGRSLNYQPGLNVDLDGKHIIDGIIADDSASGLWLPRVMKNDKDVLFTAGESLPWFVTENSTFKVDRKTFSGERHKDWFVPQLDTSHLLYVNETPDNPPSWASNNFLANKYINVQMLREKGLSAKERMYEIAGVSHSGGEYLANGKRGDIEVLDISRLMDGFIDILDAWVDKGTQPPPIKSDWATLSDPNDIGNDENLSLRLPEISCPTGVYYIFPPSAGPTGQGTTGFAAFTGKDIEPLDGRGPVKADEDNLMHNYVDMNRNATRDPVETMTQAWRRLGLIGPHDKFSRAAYTACVQRTVDKLLKERFITQKTAKFYMERAATLEFPSE